jgi:hypothetical protein
MQDPLSKVHDLKAFCAEHSNLGLEEDEIVGLGGQEEFLYHMINYNSRFE